VRSIQVQYQEGPSSAQQPLKVRGIVLKDEEGTVLAEIIGDGCQNKTAEVSLGEHDRIVGFYGSISSVGQALQGLGIITYNTKMSLLS